MSYESFRFIHTVFSDVMHKSRTRHVTLNTSLCDFAYKFPIFICILIATFPCQHCDVDFSHIALP